MAIAFDTSTDGGLTNPGTSHTFSHTCTGSDLILFVVAFGDVTDDEITGATYNGASMTLVGKELEPGAGGRWAYMWYLVNPATGANDVVISASSSIAIAGTAASYTGAKQTGVPDASTTNTASSTTSITTSVTTVADNCWTIIGARSGDNTMAGGTGTTTRQSLSSALFIGDSNGAITPAGSTSLQVTSNSSVNYATVMASFAPATAAAATKKGLSLLGVS